jgi:DNA polymerase-3 subunit delta'
VLDRAVGEGQLRHDYLFHGPARVGKATVARWLAARLNCSGDAPPCGRCPSCLRIARGTDPDVRSIQPPGEREESLGLAFDLPRSTRSPERLIGIGEIQALQHDAALASSQGRWKVYLLIGAEGLSLPAANALLKTLEEPPPRVVLVLTAVDPSDLLPTIVSRCQPVRFGLVDPTEIAAALEADHAVEPDRAILLARLAGGRPGWALDALENPSLIDQRDRALADLDPAHRASYRTRLALAERLASGYSKEPAALLQTLALWQTWWWDVALLQHDSASRLTNVDRREELERAARQVPAPQVVAHVRRLADASQWLLQNVNPRLALEALLVAGPTRG